MGGVIRGHPPPISYFGVEPSPGKPLPNEIMSHGLSIPSRLQVSESVVIMIGPQFNRYRALSTNNFFDLVNTFS